MYLPGIWDRIPEILKKVRILNKIKYCIKSVRIRSYSGLHFSHIFPHSDWIQRDTPYLSVFSPNAGK